MGHRPELRETARQWRRLLYNRIENLFTYENLPEEINEKALKLFLNSFGKIVFYKIEDKFIIQPFTYTDKLNWYYIPLYGRVVNPWLPAGHQSYTFKIDESATIFNSTLDIYNMRERSTVSDLIHKTAYQLAENDISYYCIQRNHRLIAIFTAETDLQKAECNRVLERIYEGYPDITMGDDLVSHIKVNPIAMNSTRSSITELIEFQQYILANFYHAFGIDSNYNLKREQLNNDEININREVLRLNIEDMLENRELGVQKINDIYNLSVRVSLNEKIYARLLQETDIGDTNISTMQALSNSKDDISNDTSDGETDETIAQTGETENEDNAIEEKDDKQTTTEDSIIYVENAEKVIMNIDTEEVPVHNMENEEVNNDDDEK